MSILTWIEKKKEDLFIDPEKDQKVTWYLGTNVLRPEHVQLDSSPVPTTIVTTLASTESHQTPPTSPNT